MNITKLEHSGLIIEKDGQKLVFDPVEFATTLPEIHNVVAIILTHKHGDHVQKEKVLAILDQNPDAIIIGPADLADTIQNLTVAQAGDELEDGGFKLKFFSRDHASIIEGKVPCDNLGVVVDDRIVNPGDSFDLLDLDGSIEVLFVAEAAPWCKMSECMDYIRVAKPKCVVLVHDGLLSPMGKTIYGSWFKSAADEIGAKFIDLAPGETMEA